MSSSAKSSRRCSSSSPSSTRRRSALAPRRSRQGKRRGSSSSSSAEVSEKLESLRNLIPACGGGDRVGEDVSAPAPATETLFQETADYILRLRAQVVVLQRLIQLYGSDSSSPESDAVSSAVL